MSKMTGGGLIAGMLAAEGVEVVFGIIDGTYLGLNAAFKHHGIRFITPRHETSAAHMAGAYARLTGKLGVCIASNGPGVANVLPGVAVENAEGNRVLLITSSRRQGITYPDRGGAFQNFDQTAVTAPMTKLSVAVRDVERLSEMMRRAFRVSFDGRPGVVHVDVPENIINGKHKFDASQVREPSRYRNVTPAAPSAALVREAADLLRHAELPMIHAGSGVLHAMAHAELAELAELLQAPVVSSWGGRACIDERQRLSIPMIHVSLVNEVRNAADAALILGSRVGETDWWGKPPYWRAASEQRTIQVDKDPAMLGVNRPVDVAITADIKEFLVALLAELRADGPSIRVRDREPAVAEFTRKKLAARADLDRALEDRSSPMHSSHVATVCRQVLDDDAVFVVDGGNTAIWGNFYYEVRTPLAYLSTFKFGMLGAGVAQALGAKAAHPERQVCCIIGDGAMGFHPQEVETAVRNDLPVVYLVLADKQWGMVKMTQQFALRPIKTLIKKSLDEGETINADLGEIAFDDLARSMGAHGERVSSPDELEPALRRSLESGRCVVIHVDVDPVKHMWAPSLKNFKDMHQEPAG